MPKLASHTYLMRSGLMAVLLFTTACTQSPVEVELRGHNVYGPDSTTQLASLRSYSPAAGASYNKPVSSYQPARTASYSPFAQSTHQSATISSIGVSDLPPPPAAESKPEAAAATLKPVETVAETETKAQPVKLWVKEDEASRQQAALKPVSEGASVQPDQKQPISSVYTSSASSGVDYMWPVSSKRILSDFGPKPGGRVNDGLTIASVEGEPVWAAADGEVVFVGDELKGYGNMILVKHTDGKTTTYAHLSRSAVDKYDRVKQGDIIGYVGSTGNVRDPQLYFAINDGKKAVDPQKYLSRNVAGL